MAPAEAEEVERRVLQTLLLLQVKVTEPAVYVWKVRKQRL